MSMIAKRAHFPPDAGEWQHPTGLDPAFIPGETAIAGFGSRDLFVAQIPRRQAAAIIREHHYSHRIVNNSYVHLGVIYHGRIEGALMLGYALNPACMGKVVAGATSTSYLELNRMWISDRCPRNTESQVLAFTMRYIRAVMPQVEFVQSFADERCGGLGVVYQAANFTFLGSHKTAFYELDGETYHEMLLTAHLKGGARGAYLRANMGRATKCVFQQFRYVFFLKRGARKRLRLAVMPYPKRKLPLPE